MLLDMLALTVMIWVAFWRTRKQICKKVVELVIWKSLNSVLLQNWIWNKYVNLNCKVRHHQGIGDNSDFFDI